MKLQDFASSLKIVKKQKIGRTGDMMVKFGKNKKDKKLSLKMALMMLGGLK